MASGIFGLNEIYLNQVKDSTENTRSNWPEGGSYAYITGSGTPSVSVDSSDVYRFSLSTDTTTQISDLATAAGHGMASFANAEYGYFIGGRGPSTDAVSHINKLDFSTESFSDLGNWPNTIYASSEIQTENYGYTVGGKTTNPNQRLSTITKLDLSNETTNNLPTPNTTTLHGSAGTQSETHGYTCGGTPADLPSTPGRFSTITKFDLSSELSSYALSTTPQGLYGMAATKSSGYGIFAGGRSDNDDYLSNSFKLDFSNDTCSTPSYNLGNSTLYSSTTKETSRGYIIGGEGPGTSPPATNNMTCRIFKIDFSNDSTEYLGDVLPVRLGYTTAATKIGSRYPIKGVKTYGYVACGAHSSGDTSAINRIDLSTGSVSSVGNDTFVSSSPGLGRMNVKTTSSNHYGYIAGGISIPSPVESLHNYVSRIDFTSETISSSANNMIYKRSGDGSVSTSDYGYYVGGTAPTFFSSRFERQDFATEVITISSPHNSNSQYSSTMGAPDSKYGYFCGGTIAGEVGSIKSCKIERLDFSTDIFANPYVNTFPNVLAGNAIVQNNSSAYMTESSSFPSPQYSSNILKLQFSTETTSDLAGIHWPTKRGYGTGISAEYVGYVCHGLGEVASPPSLLSSVMQLDFSTETISDTGNHLPERASGSSGIQNASGSSS